MNATIKKTLKAVFSKPTLSRLARVYNRLKTDPTEGEEGEIIRALTREDTSRYLVDVGAHDGRLYSNSYSLIKNGWQGLLIEPLPKPFGTLSRRYHGKKNVICINRAVSSQKGKSRFFIGSDGESGMTSTLNQDQNDWYEATRTNQAIDVEVETLTDLLIAHQAPREISLLLIDTEGMDYEVLQGLDFGEFRPRIILTEDYVPKIEAKNRLLHQKGYVLYRKLRTNSFWILG